MHAGNFRDRESSRLCNGSADDGKRPLSRACRVLCILDENDAEHQRDAEGEGRKARTETASRHEHLHGPWLGRGDLAPYPAWHRGDATKQLRLSGNDARAT